ncbi:terminase small subunit [Selenomonas sp. TAMA-11512]|uniref:terminase small subunit n=1 Tax=Selenomonas sp. TAMA-11512 TaxID=3095337 RepID=UPI003089A8D7|nr:terminase small subunit [Selenomonas sp. TAMA-11512]
MKLTAKQQRFIDEYLIDFNATQAALRAGYSKKTAAFIGAQNLKKIQIQDEIARRQRVLQVRTEISQDRVVKELARIAFADASDYVKVRTEIVHPKKGKPYAVQTVKVKDTSELTKDQRAAIASIKQGTNGIELKLYDKTRAIEILGRHIGMFIDKVEISGNVGIAGALEEAWRRVKEHDAD